MHDVADRTNAMKDLPPRCPPELLQAAVISVGAGLTTAWWLSIRPHALLRDDLPIAALFILLGAIAIAIYEYIAWKHRRSGWVVRDRRWATALRTASIAAVTPLLEKNAIKTLSTDVPMMFSMSRLVVLAFATGMMRQLWSVGIIGWPEATLSISVVLALPILGALERATPEQVVDVTKTLIGKLGVGDTKVELRQAS